MEEMLHLISYLFDGIQCERDFIFCLEKFHLLINIHYRIRNCMDIHDKDGILALLLISVKNNLYSLLFSILFSTTLSPALVIAFPVQHTGSRMA